MAEVAGIGDRETLEAWLKGRSHEDAICIAHRVAMRWAPLFWNGPGEDWAQKRGLALLESLWPLLTSGVARRYPNPEVKAAVTAAAIASATSTAAVIESANATIAAAATNAAAAEAAATALAAAATTTAAAAAANAAAAAAYAAAAAEYVAAKSYRFAISEAAAYAPVSAVDLPNANFNAAAASATAIAAESWQWVRMDCAALEAGRDPFTLPLWDSPVPERIADAWARTREDWAKAGGPVWGFWTRFYENALAGRPQDWPLLRDIALIPAEDWRGGPERVHPIIEGMLLEQAVKATDNGETIAINPQTGKAHIVPGSALPPDLAPYVKRKITGALKVFGTGSANQYTALQPDLALLAEVAAEADILPVELFDACASVSRRVIHRARMGECPDPETDPLLADFLHRIREAGADVLGNDPMAQDVLARRAAIAGNRAFTEGREVILAAAGVLVSASEGYLARAMPRDAEVATNPQSDPEDRRVSAFRFAGRLLRYPIAKAEVVGGAVIGVAAFIQSYQFIMALPQVQAAIQVVLKYLGYI